MIALFLTLALAQECAETRSAADLKAATAEATLSFLGADLAGYKLAREEAWATLPCVDEIVPEAQITSLHQLAALDGFYLRDETLRDGALRALHSRDGYELPEVFGDTHPLRISWQAVAAQPPAAPSDLPVPETAIVLIDGQLTLDWPTDRALFVQVLDGSGAVEESVLLGPGAAPPTYASSELVSREAYLAREVRLKRRPVELVVSSAALIGGAGALFGASRIARGRFFADGTPPEKIEPLRAQHNALLVGSGATLGLGAALGVTAAATW